MSIPLVEHRSTRVTAQPPSLADEQFARQYHAREALDRRRAIRRSLQSDQSSDSEEDVGADDEASSSEEEEEEKENIPPHSRWSDHTHHIPSLSTSSLYSLVTDP
jgi:hypothetical protein